MKQIDHGRADMDYDTISNGRFHHETLRQRALMDMTTNQRAKASVASQYGFNTESPSLQTISPALDIILSRPSNLAHSEFGGIAKLAHQLLIDAVLTKSAAQSYARTLRSFPFPPDWARLQSPVSYLGSYVLQEHARWAIIIPILLRVWLRDEHI